MEVSTFSDWTCPAETGHFFAPHISATKKAKNYVQSVASARAYQ